MPGSLTLKAGERTIDCRCDGAAIRAEGDSTILFLRSSPKSEASETFLTLNRELEALRNEHRRLTQDKEYLEERVRERTAELQAANEELQAFSYSVSHDLRSPLATIELLSEVLLQGYSEKLDAEGRAHLNNLLRTSRRTVQLVDDLLELSQARRSPLEREPVDLSALAAEIGNELSGREPDRQVQFVIQDGLTTEGDERLLALALENLMSNAWKFTGNRAKGRIEFGATEEDGRLIYYVRDNGVGFDPSQAGDLFKPFVRLHTRREFEGTGIGLATVSRIIRRHGGEIWAEAAPGRGATFFFTL